MSEEKKEQKEEQKEEEKETNDTDSKSATLADVKQIVNDALEPVKKALLGNGDSSKSESDATDEVEGEDKTAARRTRRSFAQVEADAEALVKKTVAEVLGDIEHKKEHESLKEAKKQKPEVEKPPSKPRKLTTLMWGKGWEE